MSQTAPKPDLSNIKSCADVVAHTLRAFADAIEAAQLDCECGPTCCCSCCGPRDKAA